MRGRGRERGVRETEWERERHETERESRACVRENIKQRKDDLDFCGCKILMWQCLEEAKKPSLSLAF